jgi:hypothetical protein
MEEKINVTYLQIVNSELNGFKKLAYNFMFWSIGLLLVLIAGLRPIGLDRDSLTYAAHIESVTKVNFLDKEPAYWLIKWFNEVLFHGNIHSFFLIFALLGVSIKFLAIKKLSKLPFISVIAYLSMFFVLHEMTQIRAGIAAGIFLLSIPDIYNRNFIKFIKKALLASLFHYSAIIMVPLYFLNPRKISVIYFLLPISGLLFAYFNLSKMLLTNFVGILPEFLAYKVRIYLSLLELGEHSEINILNIHYSFLLIVLYFGLFCGVTNRLKSPYDILFVKILSIMLFTLYFLSPVPVFAFRISEFLGVILIILIPHLLLTFKQKSIVLLPIIVWLITYFCVIQVGRNLNL